ncbi:MAG: 3'-5' exonuclease [Sneathiella sp.]
MSASNKDLTTLAATLENSPDYRVLSRIERLTSFYSTTTDKKTRKGLLVDVETTGLDTKTDVIIELGCILFEYGHDGTIYKIIEEYNGLQDPKIPLDPEITKLTGITDADLKDQILDKAKIEILIEKSDFIIAHNSSFDRPMLERQFPQLAQLPWGCSLKSVDWKSEGIGSAKLDYILFKLGKFHEGHRAVEDCHATLFALRAPLPESNTTAMAQILQKAREPDYRVFAYKAPFDKKDDLKARGYRWSDGSDSKAKSWYIDVSKDELGLEKDYLAGCRIPGGYIPVVKLTPVDLYTDRTLYLPSSA